MRALLILAAFVALPAAAQTTTTCNVYGRIGQCTTTAPPAPPPTINFGLLRQPDFAGDAMRAYSAGQAAGAADYSSGAVVDCANESWLISDRCTGAEIRAAKKRRTAMVGIGEAIGDRRCADAVKLAFQTGDLELGEHVRNLCPVP